MSMPSPLQSSGLTTLGHSLRQLAAHEIGLAAFERRCPPSRTAEWQALQAHVPRASVAYADLCCALDYYRAGTDESLARLLQAERVPDSHSCREAPGVCVVRPYHLAVLYRKRADRRFLDWLLDWQDSTSRGRRAHLEALAPLVAGHMQALLLACHGSPVRVVTLSRALSQICDRINEDAVWEAYLRLLERAVQTRDPRQMWSARRVQASLTPKWRRWRGQQLT